MAESFNTNLKNVAARYLRVLQPKVTSSTILKSIEENPHYPSLLSLSETFDRYHISNDAFEVTPDYLKEVQAPFVAFMVLPGIGRDFALVTAISDEEVTYFHKGKKPRTVKRQEFDTQYQNIVWIATPDDNSREEDYERKLKQEKTLRNKQVLWVAGIVLLLATAITANISAATVFAFSSITFLQLAGTATAVLLLIYETDNNNAFVKNICNAGGHSNCDAVLRSKASKIMGISWSEIGFFYFSSTLLWLFFPSVPFADKTAGIAFANAFAVPYIFFSIYYQWKIARQWCPLCLTVQAILFLELLWSVLFFWHAPGQFPFTLVNLSALLVSVLLPVVTWYGIKPVLAKANNTDSYLSAYKRLQNSPGVFTGLLHQQAKAPDDWQDLGISIGNPNATHTIIKVCNPYCGPCANVHPQLENIIEHNPDVHLKILFTASNKENDRAAVVVRHLLAIAAENNAAKTRQSLDDWYLAGKKEYESFARKYPLNGELKEQNAKIEAMRNWCEEAEITHTPTIFVNGYRLPDNYSVPELKNIL